MDRRPATARGWCTSIGAARHVYSRLVHVLFLRIVAIGDVTGAEDASTVARTASVGSPSRIYSETDQLDPTRDQIVILARTGFAHPPN